MTNNQAGLDKLKHDLAVILKVPPLVVNVSASPDTLPGTEMADGSIFVGLTKDGKQIFAMPMDLGVELTFNESAKVVQRLNRRKALGHNDWHIPTLDELRVLHRHWHWGSLRDTFNFASKPYKFDNYWLSTEYKYGASSSHVQYLTFKSGPLVLCDYQAGDARKDSSRMSCRPVRVVEGPK